MVTSVKEMMAAANAAVPKVSLQEAREMIANQGALVVDVRDAPELQASGKVKGALHVSRGMLEFRADADTPYHNAEFRKDRPIILYCASGGRSAAAADRDAASLNPRTLGTSATAPMTNKVMIPPLRADISAPQTSATAPDLN